MMRRAILIGFLAVFLGGCASRGVVLELQGSVLYESPRILAITHTVADRRLAGGTVVVSVVLTGDPGLEASFDITPEIVRDEPMTETSDGRYVREVALPPELTGGPFTIIGRLRHERAGEATLRDPDPISISLVR